MNSAVPQTFPVVIVGAGPAGTAAATFLGQRGVRCLLLDRWETAYPQPRAVHLDDEVHRIVAQLGIAEQFAVISRPAQGMRLLDSTMRVLTEFRRNPAGGTHGFPAANMFDQPELESLLRANLDKYPTITFRGGVEVTGVRTDTDRMQVSFTDRDSGQRHSVDAKYVLGCDGANSVVRSSIGIRMVDLHFTQRWLVVDIATDADLHQWDGIQHVCDPGRAATFMRIGRRRYRWEFRLHPTETIADYDSVARLYPLLARWMGDIPSSELELVRLAEYTFRAAVARRWRRGNIFILGDAAHLTPPFIGQGLGAGLRDAANLAWKLAAVLAGELPENVLDSYERERKPHAWKLIGLALAVGYAMTVGGRIGGRVRGVIISRLHRFPGVRSRVRDSATPSLSRSALIKKTWRPRQLAGTLCPNVTLPNGVQLDEATGSRITLISSEPPNPVQSARLDGRCAVVVARPASELALWLRRGGAEAVVVRPDRTVMQAGQLSTLCEAVSRLLPAVRTVRETQNGAVPQHYSPRGATP